MSRSQRKTPIFSNAKCRSEKGCKKVWHQKLRAKERTTLASESPDNLEDHAPHDKLEVSNVWGMAKDGRHYWSKKRQEDAARDIAHGRCKNTSEAQKLKDRLKHKWMGK